MSNSIINPGLRADIMRKRMEDRNTLRHKGSLFVGTGEKETINFNNEDIDIWKTEELKVPTEGVGYGIVSYRALTINEADGAQYVVLSGKDAIESFSIPVQKLVNTLNASYTLTKWGVTAENFADASAGIPTQNNGIDFTLGWTEGKGFKLTRNSNNIGQTSEYADTVTYAVDSNGNDVNIANYINTTSFQLCTIDKRSYETNPIVLWENGGSKGAQRIANITLGNITDILKISLKLKVTNRYEDTYWVDIFPGFDGWCGNALFFNSGSSTLINVPGMGRLNFQATKDDSYLSLRCTGAIREIGFGYNSDSGGTGAIPKVELLKATIMYVLPEAF